MTQVICEAASKPSSGCRIVTLGGPKSLRCGLMLLATATLGCSEPPINSGPQVAIEILNSTGLSNLTVTVQDGTTQDGTTQDGTTTNIVTFMPEGANPEQVSTGVEAAGKPVHFHVEVGDEIVDHTCHVHRNAVGNPHNVPRAVIYSEPLRVVCQSGWQEEEAELLSAPENS